MVWFKSFFGTALGIDLGTANTLIYVHDKGVVLREPSVVAVDENTNLVRWVGEEARAMIGRTPQGIRAIRPLKDGVVADLEYAKKHGLVGSYCLRLRIRQSVQLMCNRLSW